MKCARLVAVLTSVAGALACAAALAGCASSGIGSQPGASGSTPAAGPSSSAAAGSTPAVTSPSSAAGGSACATSALQVMLGASSGYAGGVYQAIEFTNTSGSTCTLTGYPGVSLVSGPPYKQIGLPAKRNTSMPVKSVTLAPGATASAMLQTVDALNFPSPSCEPTKATNLKIYPPNQFTPVYLPDTSYGCGKSVQIMYIAPVRPGSGTT